MHQWHHKYIINHIGECMEFFLDENGKKTDRTNPEGKKRRSSVKSILLGEGILCPTEMT